MGKKLKKKSRLAVFEGFQAKKFVLYLTGDGEIVKVLNRRKPCSELVDWVSSILTTLVVPATKCPASLSKSLSEQAPLQFGCLLRNLNKLD